jgi:RNA polymerase sigma-70 factor (ECF subfamily)
MDAPTKTAEPAYLALRDGLRSFVARRARPDHVDDLVQDILLRMHEHADDLRDETRLAGWAFRIAQSVVTDHHRARKDGLPLSEEDEPAAEPLEPGNVNEIVAGWLKPMIALLPDEYGEALTLVDVQGMRQRDYAERAGLSLSGAKSRVQRARKMLQDLVRMCCEIEVDVRGNVMAYRCRRCE